MLRAIVWRRLVAIALALAIGALSGCGPEPASKDAGSAADSGSLDVEGPIVVLTLASLRADLVAGVGGEAPWTPAIDRFAREADWVGTAVAASSSPIPALGTLVTGVDPWHHQALHHRIAHLQPSLPTLSGAVAELGMETIVHLPRGRPFQSFGFWRGFDRIEATDSVASTARELAALEGRKLVWIYWPEVSFPIRDRRSELPRLSKRPRGATNIETVELMPYADPAKPMPEEVRREVAELVRHETAWADRRVGRLLRALRQSPAWAEATVVLTAVHGLEIDEHGQSLFAQNLGRESIEVPLLIKLPENRQNLVEKLDPSPRVAAGRIWSTVVELAGGRPSPAHLPSLFERSVEPMFSALYGHDSKNQYSLVDTGEAPVQLLWDSPFMDPDPLFFEAQTVEATKVRSRDPSIRLKWIWDRQDNGFISALPWSPAESDGASGEMREVSGGIHGDGRLERWIEGGATREVDDSGLLRDRSAALHRRLLQFSARLRTVREEAEFRRLAEVEP